jgi:hypothetical protein
MSWSDPKADMRMVLDPVTPTRLFPCPAGEETPERAKCSRPDSVRHLSERSVTCVYRAYQDGTLVATGRLMLDGLPSIGEEVRLNGRPHVVRSVDFGDGEHVLTLEPRS